MTLETGKRYAANLGDTKMRIYRSGGRWRREIVPVLFRFTVEHITPEGGATVVDEHGQYYGMSAASLAKCII